MRGEFDKYDSNKSGSIELDELTALLDDLGLIGKLKTDRVKFTTEMLTKYDKNDDGVLRYVKGTLLRICPRFIYNHSVAAC